MRNNEIKKADLLDKLALTFVLALIVPGIFGSLFNTDVFDSNVRNPYYIHFIELLLLVIIGYLFRNNNWLITDSLATRLVLFWGFWLGLSSLVLGLSFDLPEYIQQQFLPGFLWILIYLFFYVIAKRVPSLEQLFIFYFSSLALFSGVVFIINFQLVNTSNSITPLNTIYYPLLLLPWLIVQRKKSWHFVGMLAIAVLVLFSLKRTAVFAFGASVIAYFYTFQAIKSSLKGRLIIFFGVIIVFAVGIIGFNYFEETTNYALSKRMDREALSEGSGRVDIYKDTVTLIENSTFADGIVGHGSNAVEAKLGISAHNDWLEVLYDYGLGGLIIYALLHLSLIVKTRKLIYNKSIYASAFAVSYMLFFVISLTSHLIIYPTYFIFLTAFWGMINGLTEVVKASSRTLKAENHR